MKPAILLAAILAALAIFAGCGGDDDGSAGSASGGSASAGESAGESGEAGDAETPEPVTTSSITKAQFVKQANAICTRVREDRGEEISAYLEENKGQSEEELIPGLIEIYIPTLETQAEELRELGAPRGDEKQVEAIIAGFERAYEGMKDLEGSSATPQLNKLINNAGVQARKYNLIECTYG